MATLREQIVEDQKQSLRAGETLRLSTLRLLFAAISNKEIELRKKDIGLSDQEVLDVISSEVKRRKDAILEFKKGNREDLAKKEEQELAILQPYLPPEISDEDLERIVKDGIREAGAAGEQDFGKVMKVVMPTLKGKASGDRISQVLRRELATISK